MADVWFTDSETMRHDNLWVFKNKRTKAIRVIHNDPYALQDFIASDPDMFLAGFNMRDYDQYILKGCLLGYNNEQLKELNDLLIFGELQEVWDYFGAEAWDVTMPAIIDLYHDMLHLSLKEIEGNMGRTVDEFEIDFDREEPLTPEELERLIEYCISDVEATEALYYERMSYIKAKKDLCDMVGLDDAKMMIHSNARVTAEAMHGMKLDPFETWGREYYVDYAPWHIIRRDKLPQEVYDYVVDANSCTGVTEDEEFGELLFDFLGVPTVLGVGGIHAATGELYEHTFKMGARKGQTEIKKRSIPSHFVSDDEYVVVLQDIGSFYPWIMILFDCLSRNIPDEHKPKYLEFLETRMEAKAEKAKCIAKGDSKGALKYEAIAEAAKLVLNTLYGTMKNKYNKLYDPFMATSVCLNGQLFIIDLVLRIKEVIDEIEIVQLNTDGWMLRLPRKKLATLLAVTDAWCELTGFTVDTDVVKQIWQRDVNNYVMEDSDGKITAKGAMVKLWEGGNYRSNSMSILHTALVEKMIHNVEIEDTINKCDDLEKFQMILKAGRTFKNCVKIPFYEPDGEAMSLTGKIHRVYAAKEGGYTYYKCTENDRRNRFPNAPLCAQGDEITLANLDKQWYIDMAYDRYNAFIGKE